VNKITRWEGGAGKIGTIIGLIILVAAIIVAAKMLPARIKVYDLRDNAEKLALKLGTHQIAKPEAVVEALVKKAKDLEIPLKEENIKVTEGSGSWFITLKYTYPIDFILFTYEWKIEQKLEGVKISV